VFTGELLEVDSPSLRRKIAEEAANLLYVGLEKEFKQAKLKAAKTFNDRFLPSNLEVALELDRIAEEREGPARRERLIRMREEALRLMKILGMYDPILVGSVWRGTIHHESDIDIVVYHEEPEDILRILRLNRIRVLQAEWVTVTKKGKRIGSFHIHAELPSKEKAEIKLSNPEDMGKKEKCETYGDVITGLNVPELGRMLKENPVERFIPS
jgi:predicted nucleotidyltransferase